MAMSSSDQVDSCSSFCAAFKRSSMENCDGRISKCFHHIRSNWRGEMPTREAMVFIGMGRSMFCSISVMALTMRRSATPWRHSMAIFWLSAALRMRVCKNWSATSTASWRLCWRAMSSSIRSIAALPPPSDGGWAAMRAGDEFQHQVHGRRAAGAGQAVAVDAVKVAADLDGRELVGQRSQGFPVYRATPPVEQPGPRQDHGAKADAAEWPPAGGIAPQELEHLLVAIIRHADACHDKEMAKFRRQGHGKFGQQGKAGARGYRLP